MKIGSFIVLVLALVLTGCGGEETGPTDDLGEEAHSTGRASEQAEAPESSSVGPDADAPDSDETASEGRDEEGAGRDDEAAIRRLDRRTRQMYRNGNAAGLCSLMTESEQSQFALTTGSCEEGMRYAMREIGDASQFPAVSDIAVADDVATVTYDDGTVERMVRSPRGWLRDGLVEQAE